MKKILIIVLLLLPLTSAKIEPLKEIYSPKETLQAVITIEEPVIKEISASNIELRLDNTKKSIAPILIKLQNSEYFAYFQLPDKPGIYDLSIKLFYKINDILTEKEETISIEITNSTSSLKINPALVRLDAQRKNPYFKIYLTNTGNEELNLNINIEEDFIKTSKNNILIPEGETRTLYILTNTLKELKNTMITLDNYFIPVYIYNQKEVIKKPEENITEELENKTTEEITVENETEEIVIEYPIEFLTKTEYLDLSLKQQKTLTGVIPIKNKLNEEVKNIKVELTDDLLEIAELNISLISLSPKEKYPIYLTINKNKDTYPDTYFGNLLVKTETSEIELPISIIIEELEAKEELEEETYESYKEDEEVDFSADSSLPFFAQIEEKEEVPKKKPSSKALLLFIPVIALIIFFALNIVKKKPKKKSFSDYLSKK